MRDTSYVAAVGVSLLDPFKADLRIRHSIITLRMR